MYEMTVLSGTFQYFKPKCYCFGQKRVVFGRNRCHLAETVCFGRYGGRGIWSRNCFGQIIDHRNQIIDHRNVIRSTTITDQMKNPVFLCCFSYSCPLTNLPTHCARSITLKWVFKSITENGTHPQIGRDLHLIWYGASATYFNNSYVPEPGLLYLLKWRWWLINDNSLATNMGRRVVLSSCCIN